MKKNCFLIKGKEVHINNIRAEHIFSIFVNAGIIMFCLTFLLLSFPLVVFAGGTGTLVDPYDSIASLNTGIDSASCGDTIYLKSGTYTTGTVTMNKTCTGGNEITISVSDGVSEDLGGAIFTSAIVYITGDYQILKGIEFDPAGASVISLEMQNGASYNRVTECKFQDVGNNNGITIGRNSSNNTHNRFDHCSFIDTGSWGGYMLRIRVDDVQNARGNIHNRIDHNYFRDHSSGSNYEDIQIGDGDVATFQEDNYTIVEYNLFENADSDNETVSSKSSSNIFRYNVFIDCNGALTLRAGDDCEVYANFFYFSGADVSSGTDYIPGVRVFGHNQTVINNYFEGMSAAGYGPYVYVEGGQSDDDTDNQKQVVNALIANNTFKNTYRAVHFEMAETYDPINCIIINNFAETNQTARGGTLFMDHDAGGHTFDANRGHATGNSSLTDTLNGTEVQVAGEFEITRQKTGLPVVNWYYPDSDEYHDGTPIGIVTEDIQGQSRGISPDIGSDESGGTDSIITVGCSWDGATISSSSSGGALNPPTGLHIEK